MKSAPTLSSVFLEPAGNYLPGPLLELRKQKGTALVDMPLPTRKTENWKYSVRHLKLSDELAVALPSRGKEGASLSMAGYRVVFRYGVMVPEASDFPDLNGIRIQRFCDLDDQSAAALAERLDNTQIGRAHV